MSARKSMGEARDEANAARLRARLAKLGGLEALDRVLSDHVVTLADVLGSRRLPHIIDARYAAWWAVADATGWGASRIGHEFGFDHTSVRYGIAKWSDICGLVKSNGEAA